MTSTAKAFLENSTKRAGPFLLGPKSGSLAVSNLSCHVARKEGTDDFYTIKVLSYKAGNESGTGDELLGKWLLHTEYSILSLLQGHEGVIQQRGLFKDVVNEEVEENGKMVATGKMLTRICLVLDCCTPHDFCPKYARMTTLQKYVINEEMLVEGEAIEIFYSIVKIVDTLHMRNIVHRDLKMANVLLDQETREVVLTNFWLGKLLTSDKEFLQDQRGSPAYISPEVLNSKFQPYLGKPSDMWALGVLLYTMLFGQFPFYDPSPLQLFNKIRNVEYKIPAESIVSESTVKIVQSLLMLAPEKRLTSSEVLVALKGIMGGESSRQPLIFQVVPNILPPARLGSSRLTNARKSRKRGINIENSLNRAARELSEVEAILAFSEKDGEEEAEDNIVRVHEPPTKISKAIPRIGSIKLTKLKEEPRRLTMGDLKRLHNIYLANKAKAALLATSGPYESPASQ